MESTPTPPLKLKKAIRVYWRNLIGMLLVAPVVIVTERMHLPFDIPIAFFFCAGFLAMWPCMARRVSDAFWIFAVALFMAGAVVTFGITAIFLSH